MRVLVDTNVFVSALLTFTGPPARTIDLWGEGAYELVTSDRLLAELDATLSRPKIRRRAAYEARRGDALLARLAAAATFVTPTRRITASRDPDDNAVLEAAAAGNADYIVTGDQDLLTLGAHRGIVILTPAAFASLLQA